MRKIGIIICGRYQDCGGGECFRALRERAGSFSRYSKDEPFEVVGYSYCGGCSGGNIEYVPEEMKKNGADIIHLATGLVVGYPPCPRIRHFKEFIESYYGVPVAIGTHPIPLRYFNAHKKLSFWKKTNMEEIAGDLMKEDKKIMEAYNLERRLSCKEEDKEEAAAGVVWAEKDWAQVATATVPLVEQESLTKEESPATRDPVLNADQK